MKRRFKNEDFREKKLSRASKRYKTDQAFQSKSKSYSKKQYTSNPKLRTIKCYDNSMLFIEILRQLVFVLLCIVMYDVIRSSP